MVDDHENVDDWLSKIGLSEHVNPSIKGVDDNGSNSLSTSQVKDPKEEKQKQSTWHEWGKVFSMIYHGGPLGIHIAHSESQHEDGVWVTSVDRNSEAALAGVEWHDTIVAIGKESDCHTVEKVVELLKNHLSLPVEIKFWRQKKRETLSSAATIIQAHARGYIVRQQLREQKHLSKETVKAVTALAAVVAATANVAATVASDIARGSVKSLLATAVLKKSVAVSRVIRFKRKLEIKSLSSMKGTRRFINADGRVYVEEELKEKVEKNAATPKLEEDGKLLKEKVEKNAATPKLEEDDKSERKMGTKIKEHQFRKMRERMFSNYNDDSSGSTLTPSNKSSTEESKHDSKSHEVIQQPSAKKNVYWRRIIKEVEVERLLANFQEEREQKMKQKKMLQRKKKKEKAQLKTLLTEKKKKEDGEKAFKEIKMQRRRLREQNESRKKKKKIRVEKENETIKKIQEKVSSETCLVLERMAKEQKTAEVLRFVKEKVRHDLELQMRGKKVHKKEKKARKEAENLRLEAEKTREALKMQDRKLKEEEKAREEAERMRKEMEQQLKQLKVERETEHLRLEAEKTREALKMQDRKLKEEEKAREEAERMRKEMEQQLKQLKVERETEHLRLEAEKTREALKMQDRKLKEEEKAREEAERMRKEMEQQLKQLKVERKAEKEMQAQRVKEVELKAHKRAEKALHDLHLKFEADRRAEKERNDAKIEFELKKREMQKQAANAAYEASERASYAANLATLYFSAAMDEAEKAKAARKRKTFSDKWTNKVVHENTRLRETILQESFSVRRQRDEDTPPPLPFVSLPRRSNFDREEVFRIRDFFKRKKEAREAREKFQMRVHKQMQRIQREKIKKKPFR
eukprot:g1855.t1